MVSEPTICGTKNKLDVKKKFLVRSGIFFLVRKLGCFFSEKAGMFFFVRKLECFFGEKSGMFFIYIFKKC